MMLKATNTKDAPWYVVRSGRQAKGPPQLAFRNLLEQIPCKRVSRKRVKICPRRSKRGRYKTTLSGSAKFVAERYLGKPLSRDAFRALFDLSHSKPTLRDYIG